MRTAHSLVFLALATAMLGAALPVSAADAVQPSAARPAVFDPAAPTAPLHHQALPTSGSIVDHSGDWKAANAAVARFPRGHADVIRWEKAQAAAEPSSNDMPAEAHQHHMQKGQP
ncbi:hypothetical protein DZC30_09410 [Comamonas testosteroni]|uniref:Uncharacterized protein n=1 Tax=Comamonas testosteroni TaxID=285 RepID=A0A373FMT9_COMTE|nr:hypothetical protein [Comamonas testosteroni]RGE45460.1 hypothetical protein DZC30_09410 [Comamonas testosteroni]